MVLSVKDAEEAMSQAAFSARVLEAQYQRLAAMGLRIPCQGVKSAKCGNRNGRRRGNRTDLSLFNSSHSFSVIGFQSFSV